MAERNRDRLPPRADAGHLAGPELHRALGAGEASGRRTAAPPPGGGAATGGHRGTAAPCPGPGGRRRAAHRPHPARTASGRHRRVDGTAAARVPRRTGAPCPPPRPVSGDRGGDPAPAADSGASCGRAGPGRPGRGGGTRAAAPPADHPRVRGSPAPPSVPVPPPVPPVGRSRGCARGSRGGRRGDGPERASGGPSGSELRPRPARPCSGRPRSRSPPVRSPRGPTQGSTRRGVRAPRSRPLAPGSVRCPP